MRNSILNVLSVVLIFIGIALLIPAPVSYYYNDSLAPMFISLGLASIIVGLITRAIFKRAEELDLKSVILTVVLGWMIIILVGALPYLLSGAIPSMIDAIFESVSGFTTTGASILKDIEVLPLSILFWRSLTHWVGGAGIILLIIAILPSFGTHAMQLFQTEVSGGEINKKISPRVKKTAILLLLIYLMITLIEIVLLLLGGMNLYEAAIHSFGTVATGGFSSKNLSVGNYHSAYIHYVIAIFMLLAGVNFILYCRFILGDREVFFKNREFRFYGFIVLLFTLLTTWNVWGTIYKGIEEAFRMSFFNVASMLTTTGFATANFDIWPPFSKMILFVCLFIGGCVGSTSGSIKVLRVYVLLKSIGIELLRVIHPNIVKSISIEEEVIPHTTIRKMIRFATAYLVVFTIGSIIMCAFNLDMISAMSATATTLAGAGPGLGLVGPAASYAFLPGLAKLILSFFMLLGRLEIFILLAIFTPEFWKS